jgi:glutathione synthase/RimK-type ligase-like ATP-grasp enzyme
MILVVSHPGDDHASGVLAELARDGHSAVLVDTARFPEEIRLIQLVDGDEVRFELRLPGETVDLGLCGAAWWRRPQPYQLDAGLSEDAVSFAYSECHEALAGLWAALDVHWVNSPELDERAHHKPFQLAAATAVGLRVPRTLITNEPEAARRFVSELGVERTVYKTFLASQDCWRETRILRESEVSMLDLVRLAPVIFQEYVPAAEDLRVTVVGDTLFATAIVPAPNGYQLDYRMNMDEASFAPTRLPAGVEEGIRRLMGRLGLVYGAIDFRRTPDGHYVFLEINPAGEWQFVEERTGQPITRTMAQLLVQLDQQP